MSAYVLKNIQDIQPPQGSGHHRREDVSDLAGQPPGQRCFLRVKSPKH